MGTPLYYASSAGLQRTVGVLSKKGADVNTHAGKELKLNCDRTYNIRQPMVLIQGQKANKVIFFRIIAFWVKTPEPGISPEVLCLFATMKFDYVQKKKVFYWSDLLSLLNLGLHCSYLE